jgi:hypothetical protein
MNRLLVRGPEDFDVNAYLIIADIDIMPKPDVKLVIGVEALLERQRGFLIAVIIIISSHIDLCLAVPEIIALLIAGNDQISRTVSRRRKNLPEFS